jgi:hypothetical protein
MFGVFFLTAALSHTATNAATVVVVRSARPILARLVCLQGESGGAQEKLRQRQPKPDIVTAIGGGIGEAMSKSHILSIAPPLTATSHTVSATFAFRGTTLRQPMTVTVILPVEIRAPLPHVPAHVVKALCRRLARTGGMVVREEIPRFTRNDGIVAAAGSDMAAA